MRIVKHTHWHIDSIVSSSHCIIASFLFFFTHFDGTVNLRLLDSLPPNHLGLLKQPVRWRVMSEIRWTKVTRIEVPHWSKQHVSNTLLKARKVSQNCEISCNQKVHLWDFVDCTSKLFRMKSWTNGKPTSSPWDGFQPPPYHTKDFMPTIHVWNASCHGMPSVWVGHMFGPTFPSSDSARGMASNFKVFL